MSREKSELVEMREKDQVAKEEIVTAQDAEEALATRPSPLTLSSVLFRNIFASYNTPYSTLHNYEVYVPLSISIIPCLPPCR